MNTPWPSLSTLLGNLPLAEFVAEHWDKRPLHVRGTAASLSNWIDRHRLRGIVRGAPRPSIKAYFPDPDHAVTQRFGVRPTLDISAEQVDAALAAGAGVIFGDLQTLDERIGTWTSTLRRDLGFAGRAVCSAWVAPPASMVGAHFDASSVFSFQLEGKKVWRVSPAPALLRPAIAALSLPDHSFVYREGNGTSMRRHAWEEEAQAFDPARCIEYELEPGDVLFVPAGSWHATTPAGNERTMSVSVMFEPVVLAEWIAKAFTVELMANPQWRHLPPQPDLQGSALPASLRNFWAERLEEFARALRAPEAVDDVLHRAFKRAIVEPVEGTAFRRSVQKNAPSLNLEPETILVTTSEWRWTHVEVLEKNGTSRLDIHTGEREITFDEPELIPFGRALARATRFVARDAMTWTGTDETYSWERVFELLTALIGEGILSIEAEAAVGKPQ